MGRCPGQTGGPLPPPSHLPLRILLPNLLNWGGTGALVPPSPYPKPPTPPHPPLNPIQDPNPGSGEIPAWGFCLQCLPPPPPFCPYSPTCNCIPTTNKVPIVQSRSLECLWGSGRLVGGTRASTSLGSYDLGLLSPGRRREGRKPLSAGLRLNSTMRAAQVSPEQIALIRL